MVSSGTGSFKLVPARPNKVSIFSVMAYFHQRIRTWIRIWIPNPIVTLYYAQLFPLVQIRIQIPVESTDSFPNGYCTHFRDRSPSGGQISVPIPYI